MRTKTRFVGLIIGLFPGLLASCGRPPADNAIAAGNSIVIAATTDVHGRLRGWDYYTDAADTARSLAAVATIVDSVRAANDGRVVLVDAGDLLQGNPLAFVAAKVHREAIHPVIAAMNAMRYDAAALGNHEFNYGVPHLKQAISKANFPFLAANIRTSHGEALVAPYTMVVRTLPGGDTVRVAIVGATTPGIMIWDADNVKAEGVTAGDIMPAVRQAVREVREQRADIVVVVLHSGLNEPASYDTIATGLPSENVAGRVANEVSGVDVVVFGHSHKEMIDSMVNGVLLVQPRNWAASVALATVGLQKTDGRWHIRSRSGQSVLTAGHREAPTILALTDSVHRATVAWATAPVGRTVVDWSSSDARRFDVPITDFVNEVMRKETGAQLSATAVFSLNARFAKGPISVADISTLYPYDNTLRAVRISGAQLRAFLEHSSLYYRTVDPSGAEPDSGFIDASIPGYNFDVVSGARYTIDLTKPPGSRITGLTVNGTDVQPTDTFTMALNSYRAGGGGGYAMLAGAPVTYQRDVDIRQLLIEEVQRVNATGQPLSPDRYGQRNWVIVPPLHARSDSALHTLPPTGKHN